MLYGTSGTDPRLPLPEEVIAVFSGTVTQVTPVAPTYNSSTHTITIPTVTGVQYSVNGEVVLAGPLVITTDTIVEARPTVGHKFPAVTDDDWLFTYA
jgi:hypothetical protein